MPHKERMQRAFLAAMLLLTALFAVLYACGDALGQSGAFYMEGRDFLADTLNTEEMARSLDPYDFAAGEARTAFPHANYPPLAYIIFYLLDCVGLRGGAPAGWQLAAAGAFMAASAAALLAALYRASDAKKVRRLLLCAAMLATAPMLYALERGNIIVLAVALTAAFLAGCRAENRVVRELAFLALAAAAALKVYPALLGLLLVAERRWKEAARLVLYGLLLALLPFLFLNGGFRNIPLLMENVGAHKAFYRMYIYPRYGFRLFASIFYDAHWVQPLLENSLWRVSEWMYRIFPAVDALLAAGCALTLCTGAPLWKKALAAALLMVNWPLNSGAYTALYLLPPLMLLFNEDARSRSAAWTLAALVVILSPLQIALPWQAIGLRDAILCSTSDLVRNVVCYALFACYGVGGAVGAVRELMQRRAGRLSGGMRDRTN